MLEDVVLKSGAFPEPRLTGGQLRPTDRAMAARSTRTSSSEEASRSSDDEERLLTKRSMSNTVCPLGIGADDVGPGCCVMTHRRNVPHRVVGPAHGEAAHASNAVGDAGNVVGMVLDFPTNVMCGRSAQRS